MKEILCCTSLTPFASPCFIFCLLRAETEGFLDYQGRAGIISIVRWNLHPVIFVGDFGIKNMFIRYFEPGFGAYQSLAQKIEVPFSRIFHLSAVLKV